MADAAAVCRAERNFCLIEEDEVETKPESLMDWTSVLLNQNIQAAAKPFFSEDAWNCVQSTLTVL